MTDMPQARIPAPPAPPCILVIFGGVGDLAYRLLLPALYNLERQGLLAERMAVLAIGRTEMLTEEYRASAAAALGVSVQTAETDAAPSRPDLPAWHRLAAKLHYFRADIAQSASYALIEAELVRLDRLHGAAGNCIFYLAVAARLFTAVIDGLASRNLLEQQSGAWRRLIVEKPFGADLTSARRLNAELLRVAEEAQVFRIDHYLGKETVQNIMALRFGNGLFEPLWSRLHIDHVQITATETVGVEHRAGFYEETGALRDMVPNHLFQLLAMVAMECPVSFAAEAVRAEKAKLLQAVRPLRAADVVSGQYAAGRIGDRTVPAYRAERGVAPTSLTETFVAFRLAIDNWRWAGVPFHLRTGKRMASRRTEIAIRFKAAPVSLFRGTDSSEPKDNLLILRIQPDEGAELRFNAKFPGPGVTLEPVRMNFRYLDAFGCTPSTGYETLLYDCMCGDGTVFQRADFVEAGWAIVQPVLDAWTSTDRDPPEAYAAGSSGPSASEALLAADRRTWHGIGEDNRP